MNNSNHLISGDNKGYASMLMEQYKDPGSLPGKVSGCEAWSDGIACNVNKNKININYTFEHRDPLGNFFLRVLNLAFFELIANFTKLLHINTS